MKRIYIILLTVLFQLPLLGQELTPFLDFNYYFQNFKEGGLNTVELQRIKEYKAGDGCAVYLDFRDNLVAYDGERKKILANIKCNYQVSDHLIAWNIGSTINMWDAGKLRTLTFNGGNYYVKDSIIVFQDYRYNSVNAYWNDSIYTLYTVVDDLYLPEFVGENLVVFRDNGDFYKVFWNGEIYEIGVWNTNIDFHAGTDFAAFNDPITRTFTVFEKGQLVEVESFFMNKFKAGRGFVVYEDLNGNLNYYSGGKKNRFSNFNASSWEVVDETIFYIENNQAKTYYNQEVKMVCNFVPSEYVLKNNVIAYRNSNGGVAAYIDGKNYDLTNQQGSDFEVYGSNVLVELFNNAVVILHQGQKFQY